jgi:hypothetical protein
MTGRVQREKTNRRFGFHSFRRRPDCVKLATAQDERKRRKSHLCLQVGHCGAGKTPSIGPPEMKKKKKEKGKDGVISWKGAQ